MKPLLLDLFCGAGGSARGYQYAGFDVIGIDAVPQPHYVGAFYQQEALTALKDLVNLRKFGTIPWRWEEEETWIDLDQITAIHASPPCQWATAYRRRPDHVGEYDNLISQARGYLEQLGKPYVIENVEAAREYLHGPIMCCGSSYGLEVRRHRLFECSFPVQALPCAHHWQIPKYPAATNRAEGSRKTVEVGVWRIGLEEQRRAMGINWMDLEELSEAIPPAYTHWIGRYLQRELQMSKVKLP